MGRTCLCGIEKYDAKREFSNSAKTSLFGLIMNNIDAEYGHTNNSYYKDEGDYSFINKNLKNVSNLLKELTTY